MAEGSFAAFKVFDESGVQITVSLVIPADATSFGDGHAKAVQNGIAVMLRNGFSAREPGAGEGEVVKEVGSVSRRAKINDDGTETPIIDLYPDTDNPAVLYKMFSHYLNKPEDVDNFERATGVKVSALPLYQGDAALKRDSQYAHQFIVPLAKKPCKVVLKKNPNYNPDETDIKKRKPQFLFGHWFGQEAANPTAPASNGSTEPTGASGGSASPHWAEPDSARKQIAERFARYGIRGKGVAEAMQRMEPGVATLKNSKAASLAVYLEWIDNAFAPTNEESDVPF